MDATRLSPSEFDVLRLIADGLSDQEIAAALCKSVSTVRTHRDHLMGKTGCHIRVELTRWAIAAGFVEDVWAPPTRYRANA